MIVFELAAIIALAAAPHQAEPSRSPSRERVTERADIRAASDTPHSRTDTHETPRGRRSVDLCSRSNTAYNAKTHTYRDARGKRQRCAR